MNVKVLAVAGLVLPLLGGQALAHHSFAMFDPEKLITQTGLVKEFEWTNPHVWIHIMVPDQSGKSVEYSFEMQAVATVASVGWRPDSVEPGDKVSIEFHSLEDGSPRGKLVAATLAGRKPL